MNARRILLAILALTTVIYLPGVIRNDFVTLDDMLLITNNEFVHGLSPLHIWRVFTNYDPELYVPLTLLSYQIEYTIAGLHPFLYHLDNLLLHLGSIVLVFVVLKRIIQDDVFAVVVAGVFALHPLNVEAVSWAAARKDLLSGLLLLLSIWTFFRYRETGSRRQYGWSVAFFALALMAKVSVVLLPFSIIVLELLRGDVRRRVIAREFWPFAGMALLFGIVAIFGKTVQIGQITVWKHLLLCLKALAMTMGKFVLPLGLSPFYPERATVTLVHTSYALSAAACAAVALATWTARKRMPLFSWGMTWAFLAMLPSFMNIWKKGTLYITTDRYAYLAIIGFGIASFALLQPFLKRAPRFAATAGIALLAGMIVWDMQLSRMWLSSTHLYERILAVNPDFPPALNNLGASVYEDGDRARARELYMRAIALDSTLTAGYLNLGLMLKKDGNGAAALEMLRKAVDTVPSGRPPLREEIRAWGALGQLLDERGLREEALAAYRKAIERAPESPDAHYNLAVTLQKYRMLPESREAFLAYLALVPGDIEARYRLAAMEAETGRLSDAAKNLRIVLTQDPEYPNAAEHLERIRKLMGE